MNTTNNGTLSPYYRISTAEIWISSIFLIFLIITSVIGNFLIMGVVYTNKRMRTITHYFIINNAVADLLVTALGMPTAAREQILGTDTIPFGGYRGLIFCKLLLYTQDISCSSSIFTLVAIAMDRFCVTFFPFKRLITMSRAKWIMGGIWLVSLILPLPIALVVKISKDPDDTYFCQEDWSVFRFIGTFEQVEQAYTMLVFILWYATPLIIMTFLYCSMIKKVWKRTIPGQETPRTQQIQYNTKMKVLKLLISVVICFALCWLPYHVMFLYYAHGTSPALNIWLFCNSMRFANSSITPWIYVVFSRDYRVGVKNIILRCCLGRKPSNLTLSTSSINLKERRTENFRNNITLRSYINTGLQTEHAHCTL